MIGRAILVLLSLAVLTGAQLPETAPIPLKKPTTAAPAEPVTAAPAAPASPPLPETVPVPTPSPEPTAETATPPEKATPAADAKPQTEKPETAKPEPEKPDAGKPQADQSEAEKPEASKSDAPDDNQSEKTPEAEQPAETPEPAAPAEPPPRPIEVESDADFALCRAALTTLGAEFTPEPRIDDGGGCGIDKPIRISRLMTGVTLAPDATVRCETALELAQWAKTVVIPAAETAMPDVGRLTGINQASGYVCRKRNHAEIGKISEHASGNAIDLVSLTFENATVPLIIAAPEDSTLASAFQRALNATACLYFSTVLSPGSDATHQDHMHLDVLERKGGYRYCR